MLHSPAPFVTSAPPARPVFGHDRRATSVISGLFMAMLDEIDYGMLLVQRDGTVIHCNRIAHETLLDEHALYLDEGRVVGRRAADAQKLQEALQASCGRGLRKLLTIGTSACSSTVAVIPMPAQQEGFDAGRGTSLPATLLLLGKRRVCEDLSVQWFARAHELTPGEVDVLAALCVGDNPATIAKRRGVALSTVRSQVANIRIKTRADSVPALVRQVAALPPMVSALRGIGRTMTLANVPMTGRA